MAVSLQAESSALLSSYVTAYNSDVSRTMRAGFILTLEYGEAFIQPILLMWNGVWYFFKLLGSDVILPLLLDNAGYTLKLISSIGMLAKSTSLSVVSYVLRVQLSDCSIDRLMGVEQLSNGTLPCFVPGRRSLDLVTPMADVRLVVMYGVLILRNSCKVLTPPIDIIAYPFLDINLAKALHSIVNAFLYWFVAMPIATVKRCSVVSDSENPLYPTGHWMRFVMCTPDATPGFNYMITGVRRLGQLVDNWSNALWMILLASLGLPVPTCVSTPLSMKPAADLALFGGNETRVVGLTSGAYAITDGVSVYYSFFLGQTKVVWSPFSWKGVVSMKLGVAAVMYDSGDDSIDPNSGQMTMSMMGCRCTDVLDDMGYEFDDGGSTRMVIECSILRYDPGMVGTDEETQDVASPHYVPVAFGVPSAALYMRCATTKIVVDSARFPLSRLGEYTEGGRGRNYDDDMDGEFTRGDGVDSPDEVDAVVWVIPACDADSIAPQCQPSMIDAGCFPYCLGARMRGGRNDGITLYSQRDWENNVQLMQHDCSATVSADTSTDVIAFMDNRTVLNSAGYKGVAYNTLDFSDGAYVFKESWDPRVQDCVYNPTVTSRVTRGM
jgi:hypothetical protein